MTRHFVAVDLGASSGRTVLGSLADGKLTLAETHRFANAPVEVAGTLRWDVASLEAGIREGIARSRAAAGDEPLGGIGVDSWGVDYVLLDERGAALQQPFHYRDRRTDGVMERVCADLGREVIFRRTGVQFMSFNTLYQLAAEEADTLARASGFLMIADFFAHRLGGRAAGEVTLASTSQMVDPRTRTWATDLASRIGVAAHLLPGLVEAGTTLGECDGIQVLATAAHDTASAVVGCPGRGDDWAFLSSGTWSLLGVELAAPVVTDAVLDANLSNELGIRDTTRLLKNICGLWPVQECRREWSESGRNYTWDELSALAAKSPPLPAVLDPDDRRFLAPASMTAAVADYCAATKQPAPSDVGAAVRLILEGLALKCRRVLELLESVTGRTITTVNMVGGGVRNTLLCQLTADAAGRLVVAGPVEATATGNLLTQAMATGCVGSLDEAREIIRRSTGLTAYTPHPTPAWTDAYGRLLELMKT
ncbi:MAG TPA: rhamnulokinase family protein [Planctomycetota bacterium]|nr:rhamnulokinase family protein [Planctomycetota bacterium]